MKKQLRLLALAAALCAPALFAKPVPVVFDTDMGNDIDDVLALSILHALESKGECEIAAVTTTKDNRFSPILCDVINTFYGRPEIPIGEVKGSGVEPNNDRFAGVICERKDADGRYAYARRAVAEGSLPDAVKVLRRALADAEDNSLVFIVVGFSTNMARLLISPPDEISPLDGKALLSKKGKLVSMMAGEFIGEKKGPEYNIMKDVASAREFIADCPIPIVFSGFEIGVDVAYPWESVMKDFAWAKNHPIVDSFWLYRGMRPHDRPSWDLCSALYAVRPDEKYFSLSEEGTVAVDPRGYTRFTPAQGGLHRVMKVPTPEQKKTVVDTFIELASRPIDGAAAAAPKAP